MSNTLFNILGTPFFEKYVESIRGSSHTLEIKHNFETKSVNFFESSTKSKHYYSRLFPVIGDHALSFQSLNYRILIYFLAALILLMQKYL